MSSRLLHRSSPGTSVSAFDLAIEHGAAISTPFYFNVAHRLKSVMAHRAATGIVDEAVEAEGSHGHSPAFPLPRPSLPSARPAPPSRSFFFPIIPQEAKQEGLVRAAGRRAPHQPLGQATSSRTR
ncbi:hypothetical protein C8R43DRAFT_942744 [Mycena crocata]|nr:hypothetical protein C8R43DRAFT_942744 [Mycena crocata]